MTDFVAGRSDDVVFRFALARALSAHKRGDLAEASAQIEEAERAATLETTHHSDLLRGLHRVIGASVVRELFDAGDHTAVVSEATRVIEVTRSEAGDDVFQMLNDSLFALGDDAVGDYHRLEHRSGSLEAVPADGLVGCLVVRDGMWRIQEYFESLRAKGMTRFFVFDNASTDGTADYLGKQHDVTLWHAPNSFSAANSGAAWFDVMLRRHAMGAWTLILDLDEDIRVPGDRLLPDFCRDLDERGFLACTGLHLDLYQGSEDDSQQYHDATTARESAGGGLFPGQLCEASAFRRRVFGTSVLTNKAPLQRFEQGLRLCLGQHFTHHDPSRVSPLTCVVLHHKFTGDYHERVRRDGENEDHHPTWRRSNAMYSAYEGSLYDPDESVPLGSTGALVERGILRELDDLTLAEIRADRAAADGGTDAQA